MIDWIREFLVRYPEFTLFLAIGAGYWFGAVTFWGFRFGPVTGSLFAGIAIGQLAHVPVSGTTKSFLFLLFLFGIGYSVGPQFMQALKRDGLRPMALTVVMCLTGLAVAFAVSRLLGLDAGFAAGLVSGALTESPAMGTATEAINALPLPEPERARLVAHIAVADAVCYLFGAVGVIWFCSQIGPRLLGVDLQAEALKVEQALGIVRDRPGVASAWRPFELRAYRLLAQAPVLGRTLREAEALIAQSRSIIQRIRRGGEILEAQPELRLEAGDVLAIAGRREVLIEMIGPHAEEVEDRDLLDIPVTMIEAMLARGELDGQRLGELAEQNWARGVYLRGIRRGGESVPIAPGTALQRGDLVRIVGPETAVKAAASRIGPIVLPAETTDFVVLGLAIFLGGMAGVLVQFHLGDMRISLSTSVGTLLAGLVVGHLRTRMPLFGRIPDGAVSLMTALGLAAFVALTGLHAGPIFFGALREAGIGLFLGGIAVTLAPLIVGLYFGHYVLRMNPILLLGALAGAQTFTAAMAAVQERSGSPVAVLGFTPAVPLGHILLTTWGTVIVGLVA
ncbi:aspartate-alanine antiporter [Teichococcus oryzae]|uniref:Aspartate-alanine antiporter n=1 Tax=Teichococcus oryzae TaxID=1608942 RepID=A0A5B2TEE5_9PROT|nr:aspartate-alanine antiporter [Pseudoroseomonas oryzae]KAA2212841.1 aspartate-alanine antiporter [Pseudoroseomonas oryzae]